MYKNFFSFYNRNGLSGYDLRKFSQPVFMEMFVYMGLRNT